MIDKPLAAITEVDLQALIESGRMEDRTLDYKAELALRSESEKRDFANDIAAFANRDGGDLVVGISDEDGRPVGLVLGPIHEVDVERQRIVSVLSSLLEPRVPDVQVHAVSVSTGCFAVVIRVAQSWLAPHMFRGDGLWRFYLRESGQKVPMDVTQIRDSFLRSGSLRERTRRFVDSRVGAILAGDTPVSLKQGMSLSVHLTPSSIGIPAAEIAIQNLRRDYLTLFAPFMANPDYRFNIDGFVSYRVLSDETRRTTVYCQIFRDGSVEAVTSAIDVDPTQVNPDRIEKFLVDGCGNLLDYLLGNGQSLPYLISTTLFHVRGAGYFLSRYDRPSPNEVFDRDVVRVPEVLIDRVDVPTDIYLRPVFDALWQAAGHPACPRYGPSGRLAMNERK